MTQPQATLSNPFQMTPLPSHVDQSSNGNQHGGSTDPFASLANAGQGADDLFNFDVDVSFNLDGFWDDFTLGEGSGFPFR